MESYRTVDIAKETGLSLSSVQQYSNALDRHGYVIERNKQNHRVFSERDFELFRTMKRLMDEKGLAGDKLIKNALGEVQKPTAKSVSEIQEKEYKGQRVVTFKDIDEVHGRPSGTAKRNFKQNERHFIKNEDYYFLDKGDLEGVRNSYGLDNRINEMYLFTESGYLMLVKSFTDDLAWKVQRELVKNYFRVKEVVSQKASYEIEDPIARAKRWIEEQEEKLLLEQRIAEYEPKVTYYDKILQSKDSLTVTQIAKDYGLTAQKLNQILKEQGIQYKLSKQWLLYKDYADKGYTKTSTTTYTKHDGTIGTSMLTKWTQKGRLFIHELLTGLGYDPDDLGDSE